MTDTLLTTGETARQLGVSRQHVVDLCERGELDHVMVGKHRRVRKSEVERIVGYQLTREQERSLWLHRALLAPLLSNPEHVVRIARENLTRWTEQHRADGMTAKYLADWESILDSGLDSIQEVLISPSETASELRQNSPFAGVLDEEIRSQVLGSFAKHWRSQHALAA